jgi:hypothetical protein
MVGVFRGVCRYSVDGARCRVCLVQLFDMEVECIHTRLVELQTSHVIHKEKPAYELWLSHPLLAILTIKMPLTQISSDKR